MEKLDRDAARGIMTSWLSEKMPYAEDLAVVEFAGSKAGNSAETILFDVSYRQEGRARTQGLVLRRQFEGTDLFLNSDLRYQYRVLEAMAKQPQPRTPEVIGLEMDRAVLGAPFYVMRQVEGRIVQQFPNYNREGWLADQSPAQRGAAWRHAIEAMAKVHKIDWRDDFQFMSDPARSPASLEQYLNFVEEWFHWAAAGREQPTADKALEWLKANKPKDAAVGLLWGDAIPSNILFAPDNSVAALIDWEMAAIGPGEVDLGWWLFFDHLFAEGGFGVPRLEGLPDRDEMIGIYEAAAGRKVRDIDYYEVLAMLRLGIISVRQFDRQMSFGRLTPGSKAYANNPTQAMIARKLGLPAPEVGADFAEMQRAATGH